MIIVIPLFAYTSSLFLYNLFSLSFSFFFLHVNATKFIFPRHYFFPRDYFRSITTENRCSLEYSLTGFMYNLIKKIYIYIFFSVINDARRIEG